MLVLRYVGVKVQKREAGHMVPAGLSEEVSGKKLVPFMAQLFRCEKEDCRCFIFRLSSQMVITLSL